MHQTYYRDAVLALGGTCVARRRFVPGGSGSGAERRTARACSAARVMVSLMKSRKRATFSRRAAAPVSGPSKVVARNPRIRISAKVPSNHSMILRKDHAAVAAAVREVAAA